MFLVDFNSIHSNNQFFNVIDNGDNDDSILMMITSDDYCSSIINSDKSKHYEDNGQGNNHDYNDINVSMLISIRTTITIIAIRTIILMMMMMVVIVMKSIDVITLILIMWNIISMIYW